MNAISDPNDDSNNMIEDLSQFTGAYSGKKIKIRIIKGITAELEKISVPESVRIEANKIFLETGLTVRKGQKMNYVLFYCIYQAYKRLGNCQVPKKIAGLVGIQNNEIAKANSICKSNRARKDHPDDFDNFVPFTDLVHGYCEDLGIDQLTADAIKAFGQDLRDKYSELDEMFPQNIAAGLIYYYLTIHIGEQDRKSFAAKVKLSDVTINSAFKTIKNYHNLAD